MILMSTTTIAVIVAAVAVVAVLLIGVTALRRRRLQQRFGPEYDRLAGERDSKLKAESELTGRERRVRGLDIQPLTDSARARYALQWAGIQEQFVDTPADAVASSQLLVVAAMTELGYPADDPDQVLADLSVEHAATLGHFRAAEQTSRNAAAGAASTEDLRLAMINYRAMFRDLVGEPAEAGNGSPAAEPAPVARAADVHVADTQPDIAAADPVADGPSQQLSRTNARS
jgi:FtsZ-interacting cell division protein ZipA